MKQRATFSLKAFAVTGILVLASIGCSTKPDLALCGQYYRHLLQLHQSQHRAVLAAMKTSQGKDAVINYCMALEKNRVQCVLESGDTGSAVHCESGAQPTMMDGLRERFDDFTR